MIKSLIIVGLNEMIVQAMCMMCDKKIGCLFVVQNDELIGIIIEMDFLCIIGCLMEWLEVEFED